MARVRRAVIEDRQMKVLLYFVQRAEPGEYPRAVLSLATIGADCGLSTQQVRLVLKKLKTAKLICIEPREMPNGGTAENAYVVTAAGRRALEVRWQRERERCVSPS